VLIWRLADAYRWVSDLRDGKQLSGIARRDGHSPSYTNRKLSTPSGLNSRVAVSIVQGKLFVSRRNP
jgi:hypothetical protein